MNRRFVHTIAVTPALFWKHVQQGRPAFPPPPGVTDRFALLAAAVKADGVSEVVHL
jgi:hypothetical protein